MTFWQLHGPPRSRPATPSVRTTLYSELSDYGYHPHFAVHHPDLTFESGFYVRPVIYWGSDNVYGDSFYCVYQYLWGRGVTEYRWYCSTPPDLCTYDQIRWISYVCAPSQLTQTVHIMVNLIDPFLQTNFHCATTLSCHYIQYSALEPCSCPGCCMYTYMAPNTPTILPYSTFLNPHSCGLW